MPLCVEMNGVHCGCEVPATAAGLQEDTSPNTQYAIVKHILISGTIDGCFGKRIGL